MTTSNLGSGQLTREQIEAMFARRQEALDNLDVAALSADYAEDCVVESPAAGTLQGAWAVDNARRAWFEAFPDLTFRTDRLVIDGNTVVQIATLEGTDIGGFMGLPPSGKTFRVPAVFTYQLQNGKIVREQRVYDFTGLLVQIGTLKAKPA
jgi:steroid delta-isomerase-like uncharacterized protein